MTDAERFSRDWLSMWGQVGAIFEAPESAAPPPSQLARRCWLRLWMRPSFRNHRCWTIWGPAGNEAPDKLELRRIVWRTDVDSNLSNPTYRLKQLGKPIEPTLEVTDEHVNAHDLAARLDSLSFSSSPAKGLLRARPIALDGEHYGLDIEADMNRCRIEWFGVNLDWTPTDPSYDTIARWARDLSAWLDNQLDDT